MTQSFLVRLTFIVRPVFTELITDPLEDENYQRMRAHLQIFPKADDVIVGTPGYR